MKVYSLEITFKYRYGSFEVKQAQTDGVNTQVLYYCPETKHYYLEMLDQFPVDEQFKIKEALKNAPCREATTEFRSMFSSREPFWACDREVVYLSNFCIFAT